MTDSKLRAIDRMSDRATLNITARVAIEPVRLAAVACRDGNGGEKLEAATFAPRAKSLHLLLKSMKTPAAVFEELLLEFGDVVLADAAGRGLVHLAQAGRRAHRLPLQPAGDHHPRGAQGHVAHRDAAAGHHQVADVLAVEAAEGDGELQLCARRWPAAPCRKSRRADGCRCPSRRSETRSGKSSCVAMSCSVST